MDLIYILFRVLQDSKLNIKKRVKLGFF